MGVEVESATPPRCILNIDSGAVNAGSIPVSGAGHTTGQVYNLRLVVVAQVSQSKAMAVVD